MQHVEFIRERKLLLEDSAHAKALAEPLKGIQVRSKSLPCACLLLTVSLPAPACKEFGRVLTCVHKTQVQADREGVMRRACELVDCRVPFLATVFALPPKDKKPQGAAKDDADTPGKPALGTGSGAAAGRLPSLLPEKVAADKDTLRFLERLGLRKEIDDLPFFITCARSLARLQQVWRVQGDACGVTAKDMVSEFRAVYKIC
jgi:hypothetical protein